MIGYLNLCVGVLEQNKCRFVDMNNILDVLFSRIVVCAGNLNVVILLCYCLIICIFIAKKKRNYDSIVNKKRVIDFVTSYLKQSGTNNKRFNNIERISKKNCKAIILDCDEIKI